MRTQTFTPQTPLPALQVVIVRHDPKLSPPAVLLAALNAAHLDASIPQGRKEHLVRERQRPPVLVVASGVLLAIALLSYIPSDNFHHLEWVALGSVAVGVWPILGKALASARNWTLDINALMVIAVAGKPPCAFLCLWHTTRHL
jgi:Zn2+/Cd2+-exporting ATPase